MSAPTAEKINQVADLMKRLMVAINQEPQYEPEIVLNAVLSSYLNLADWADVLDQVPQALTKLSANAAALVASRNQQPPSGASLH